MKILYISHERKMGGANKSLLELLVEMKNRGHDVACVVLFHGCPIDQELRKRNIKTYACPFAWWMQPMNWSPILKKGFGLMHFSQILWKYIIVSIVKKHGYELIHSNSSVIDIGYQASCISKIPHIWHFREYGRFDYYLEYMLGLEKSMEIVKRENNHVIFVSEDLRSSYGKYFNDGNSYVIHHGVRDSYIIDKKEHNINCVSFLISGNISVGKNQMLVLKAVKLLVDKGIGDFKVLIAGESTSLTSSREYKQELVKFMSDNNLDKYISMLGFVTDMKEIRCKTDVEIVASRREAYGRVTVEGMLAHNPIIVSDVGANTELVCDRKTGLIFKDNDEVDLAEKMYYFINNKEDILTMGEAAFSYAFNNEMIKNNVAKIERVYFDALKS